MLRILLVLAVSSSLVACGGEPETHQGAPALSPSTATTTADPSASSSTSGPSSASTASQPSPGPGSASTSALTRPGTPDARTPSSHHGRAVAAGRGRRVERIPVAKLRAAFSRAIPTSTPLVAFWNAERTVFCRLSSHRASCELRSGRVTSPTCPGQPGPTSIGRIDLDRAPRPVCNSDSIIDAAVSAVLPDGRWTTAPGGAIRCLARKHGISCLDDTIPAGFTLAPWKIRVAP
ncbi:hypothetical protein [Austwickia sp. TVS 96-490-7B]|uniref:hypothetical protein n=1 Tax=Austwickia sp. TVS 96-490-7B TaxID=2830843 RepID=UPI001C586B3B|nr:hypothetical protein [Austwickia sp. TVS 96-490-7B]